MLSPVAERITLTSLPESCQRMVKPTRHPPTLISLRLRRARHNSVHEDGTKVTMREIGEMIGTDDNQMWKYETGRVIPTPKHLNMLAPHSWYRR